MDLPAPSPPSKHTKSPVSENTLTGHTLRAGWDRQSRRPHAVGGAAQRWRPGLIAAVTAAAYAS
ncbi:hypothetical protein GCM10011376_08720 [Nocardioides flavus (ex Wang et al. 2016)]|uniref:Uncharacterized protein n=1 Tax=Nocardioides flavus (ex Wang et al. 2016) TaxID=2058780 RepID=A0ABQ3HII5_9ACTN|nr:hypothetical protein GCM10011376_08720 [Nocardioides flavus (ex Wang et al. 2016)]